MLIAVFCFRSNAVKHVWVWFEKYALCVVFSRIRILHNLLSFYLLAHKRTRHHTITASQSTLTKTHRNLKGKGKGAYSFREIHLRTTGRHLSMGSHSVICHPTEVTAPPSPQPVGTRFIDPIRMKGWVELTDLNIFQSFTRNDCARIFLVRCSTAPCSACPVSTLPGKSGNKIQEVENIHSQPTHRRQPVVRSTTLTVT